MWGSYRYIGWVFFYTGILDVGFLPIYWMGGFLPIYWDEVFLPRYIGCKILASNMTITGLYHMTQYVRTEPSCFKAQRYHLHARYGEQVPKNISVLLSLGIIKLLCCCTCIYAKHNWSQRGGGYYVPSLCPRYTFFYVLYPLGVLVSIIQSCVKSCIIMTSCVTGRDAAVLCIVASGEGQGSMGTESP